MKKNLGNTRNTGYTGNTAKKEQVWNIEKNLGNTRNTGYTGNTVKKIKSEILKKILGNTRNTVYTAKKIKSVTSIFLETQETQRNTLYIAKINHVWNFKKWFW